MRALIVILGCCFLCLSCALPQAPVVEPPAATPEAVGFRWLKAADTKLYRWPADTGVLRFEVRQNVLEPSLAEWAQELAAHPDPSKQVIFDGLKQMKVTGTFEPSAGAVTAEVTFPEGFEANMNNPGLQTMRDGIDEAMRGMFMTLNMHRVGLLASGTELGAVPPSLRDGEQIKGVEELAGEVVVETVYSEEQAIIRYHIDRQTEVLRFWEFSGIVGRLEWEPHGEALLLKRLSLEMPNGTFLSTTVTHQEVGTLVFPSKVAITGTGRVEQWFEFELLDGASL